MAKVTPGQDFSPSAKDWNSFVDAASFVKRQTSGNTNTRNSGNKNLTVVRVYNDSGGQLNRFEAVGISDIIQPPQAVDITHAATQEFFNTTYKVKKPTKADKSKWLVLLEDIPSEMFGMAIAYGLTPCKVNIQNVADVNVETDVTTTIPKSGAMGYEIVWVAGGVGTATATGEQYAVINVGSAAKSIRFKPTSNADGGGKYNGKSIGGFPTVSASGNLSASDIGTISANEDLLCLNLREEGRSTHDVVFAGFLPLTFIGLITGTTSDGKTVVEFDGLQWEDCEDPE